MHKNELIDFLFIVYDAHQGPLLMHTGLSPSPLSGRPVLTATIFTLSIMINSLRVSGSRRLTVVQKLKLCVRRVHFVHRSASFMTPMSTA